MEDFKKKAAEQEIVVGKKDDEGNLNNEDLPKQVFDGEFNKSNVLNLQLNLFNLIMCLKVAFKGLQIVQNADIVLAIGNTGAGKSTMLTALVFGSHKLK